MEKEEFLLIAYLIIKNSNRIINFTLATVKINNNLFFKLLRFTIEKLLKLIRNS